MADNATLTNQKTTFDADTNSDVPVRSTEKATKQVQHVIVDWGGTGAEDTTLPDFATQTTLSALNTKVTTVDTTDVRQATHDNLNGNANIQVGNVDVGGANPVPISAASLPLPSGAATSALQLPDNHQVTANAGTNLNTSALALESGGNLAAIATDTGNIDTSLNNIEAGYAAEGSALGSGVLLQGDDGTDRKNINVDATTGDVQVDVTNTVTVGSHDVTNAGTFAVQVTSDPALSHTTDSVTIGDGSNTATIRNLASNDALNVAIVDGSGNQVTSFGGSGGTSATDDSAFTAASGSGTPIMGFATSDAVDAGDVGVLAMDTNRNLKVSIEADNVGIGGGTQYTEDAAAAADPVGTAQILVRQDTPATLVSTDGDNVARRGTNYGAAYTQIVTSSGSFVDTFGGGTQYTEGDTDATITGTALMMEGAGNALVAAPGTAADGLLVNLGTNNDVTVTGTVTANAGSGTFTVGDGGSTISVDDGAGSLTIDNAALSVTGGGVEASALRVTIANDSTGVLSVDDNGSSLTVDGTVAATQSGTWNIGTVTPGTGATNLGKAEDAAHTSGDVGVFALGVRNDGTSQTSRTSTTGDYSPISTDTNGNILSVGNLPHDAADAGNPVKIGGKGYSLAPTTTDTTPGPTAVAASDRTNLMTGLQGELVAVPLAKFATLTAINVAYDTSNETNTSANIDCFRFRTATLGATVVKTLGTPTDIQFIIEVSLDGTQYFEMKNGALGQWIYDDTYLASSKSVSYTFDIACQKIRVKVATNGTDGSNIFTVSNACLYLRS